MLSFASRAKQFDAAVAGGGQRGVRTGKCFDVVAVDEDVDLRSGRIRSAAQIPEIQKANPQNRARKTAVTTFRESSLAIRIPRIYGK